MTHLAPASVSVIISTYDAPAYLERVLWGYAVQTRRPDEIVVADDGSGPATAALIERMRVETALPIVHVWQADVGFRKSLALNRAIVRAAADYLLFTDGDCIPRADLVATHVQLACADRYIAGGYLKLPAVVSERVGREDITSGRIADLRWLRRAGWRPGRRALRLTGSRRLAALYDALTPTRAEFQGNNASVSRAALVAVNGFESLMGYGGLDKELGRRLQNLGVRGLQARHRAVCLHLHHERPYRRPEALRAHRARIARISRGGATRARSGLAELTDQAP
jgi:glycosyltransferase involved in cell wall biosynthesis